MWQNIATRLRTRGFQSVLAKSGILPISETVQNLKRDVRMLTSSSKSYLEGKMTVCLEVVQNFFRVLEP